MKSEVCRSEKAFRAPLVPKVSAENAWVPWSTAGGSIKERDERAGAGERRRERATPPLAQRWGREEPEGRRRRQAEEVGGVGRSPAPVARRAAVCSLPATRRALIRRPEPPGRPLPPLRPRHARPGPAPPAPARAGAAGAGGAGRSGEDAAGGWPQAGSGFETTRGLEWPGFDPHTSPQPGILSFPARWARGGGSPGEPRTPTGGTCFELIIGRGRVQRPVLGFRKFTSSYLHCSPSRGPVSPERTPGTFRSGH
ncbi:uncharacterized protein LOC141574981 [Camelus bactrianus]|uniref:Uncharacterized protein LOC141574981 n=1 Tax=Camelus bactrianus TaxID=9837 RepID=A0AC58PFU1_CAMBA